MPRLFTGLAILPDVTQHLSLMRGGLHGARWIDPENYHVTLRFIGDIEAPVAREIAATLAQVDRASFTLRITGLASFGGRKPRALIATVEPEAALLELQAEHERLMRRLGLPAEGRKFTPHVTLARLRDTSSLAVAEWLSQRGYFTPLTVPVSRFVLYSSRASTGGGPYVAEQVYPLWG
ncbi:MAG: RNA 2',3'-cyclic phosphodiesterase [Rhizobiales bacterium]|nr:RNA 2',3'-cyclic phosphodiesterase [Hyphomicrobiales bacterium]OJY41344.1 MAG: 2'-5' RNA ligase [Rhizobiales bacterium 64-17]